MCGICGLVQSNNSISTVAVVKKMADQLKHRGPDDEGYLAVSTAEGSFTALSGDDSQVMLPNIDSYTGSADLCLGHRRLSIIDLSAAGHQPMSHGNDELWLVYNGEIYNHEDLRQLLSSRGYSFKTRTDSEVLLAAYCEWGENCLDYFDGMWSFVIYDKRRNLLFGSRDRFGVKPFYYSYADTTFAFASEVKALLTLNELSKKLNDRSVFEYLAFSKDWWSDGSTFYKDVLELPPAHAFVINLNNKNLNIYQYYQLPYQQSDAWSDYDREAGQYKVQTVREMVFDAVRSHLISDVPVGTCLSGGIDSSSIVCAISSILNDEMIKEVGETPRAFTASYGGLAIDESKWARVVVEKTQAKWYQVFPDKDALFDDLSDLISTQEFPFGSTSIYAQYRVMKLAQQSGVKVLLDGQGGDELFAGYTPYFISYFQEMLKKRACQEMIRELKLFNNAPLTKNHLLRLLLINSIKNKMPLAIKQFGYKYKLSLIKYISPFLVDEFYDQCIEAIVEDYSKNDSLNEKLVSSMTVNSLPTLLRYEDKNSMRFSMESRTPFADHRKLIETVFSLPAVYKIRTGYSKWLLREAMKPELPEIIYKRRDKIGFATPEYDWIRGNENSIINQLRICESDYLQVDKIIKDWNILISQQPKQGITDLWRLINLLIWEQGI